jgi:hypothetical protein
MITTRILAALFVVLFTLTACTGLSLATKGATLLAESTGNAQIEQATEILTEVAGDAVPLAGIVNITNTNWVMLGLLILGWILPSPGEILRTIFNPIGWLIKTLLIKK